jgi:MFS transporter, PAT family, beta-lactamase induction signal transducer AmpG
MEHKYLLGGFYSLIYFLEGILITYFTGFNIIYLRTFDLSFTTIGLISSIALIPLIIKVFIGLYSDSINTFGMGHRKPLIIAGLLLEGIIICLVPFFSPVKNTVLFTAVLFLAPLGMATFDTATDGYALDRTPKDKRGFVQGIMVGGRAVGMVLAAASIGYVTEYYGWHPVFFGIGAITILPILYFFFVPAEVPRKDETSFSFSSFKSFASVPVLFFILVGFLYPLVIYNVEGIANPFLKEGLKISMLNVGFVTALFGIGTGVGAALGGAFIDRAGHRLSLIIALVVSTATILPIAATHHLTTAYVLLFLFGMAFGYYETVYFALSMDFSDPRIAATMFAVFMAIGNLGIAVGQPLAGILVDNVGFRWTFVVFAAINLAVLPMIPVIFRKRKAAS